LLQVQSGGFPDCLSVLLNNFLFCGSGKFLSIDNGRDARRRFSMSLELWLVWLITSASCVRKNLLSPLAILLEGVLVMPAWLPVLAGHTLWYPWVIIGVLALAYLTSVLPITPGAEVSASKASRRIWGGSPLIGPFHGSSTRLCFCYLVIVHWIALNTMSEFGVEAKVMVFFR
jgi:hypothetical protein